MIILLPSFKEGTMNGKETIIQILEVVLAIWLANLLRALLL